MEEDARASACSGGGADGTPEAIVVVAVAAAAAVLRRLRPIIGGGAAAACELDDDGSVSAVSPPPRNCPALVPALGMPADPAAVPPVAVWEALPASGAPTVMDEATMAAPRSALAGDMAVMLVVLNERALAKDKEDEDEAEEAEGEEADAGADRLRALSSSMCRRSSRIIRNC